MMGTLLRRNKGARGARIVRDRGGPRSRSRLSEPLIVLLAVLMPILLFGGASRADVATHSLVRAVAIAGLAWSVARGGWLYRGSLRAPVLLLAAWLVMVALQLMPLPPGLWSSLPGREAFAEVFESIGQGDLWRPLTFSPAATTNSLFALFIPLAVLVALARTDPRHWRTVLLALLAYAALSAMMGIVQIVSQARWSYFYRITTQGAAVGLFANRNHQALLMALSFPLLALFAAWPSESTQQRKFAQFVALAGAVLLVPLILITGSRAGLVLMVIGIIGAWLIYRGGMAEKSLHATKHEARRSRAGRLGLAPLLLTAGLVALVGATVILSRAEAVQRLFSQDVAQEIRVRLFPVMLDLGNSFAPWGTGFGTFDPLFRMVEPFDNLNPIYVNRAHNDLLEIYIEGGILALAIAAGFLFWLVRSTLRAWRPVRGRARIEVLLARTGSAVLAMQLVGSLADYPLRTPAHAAIAAVAVGMVAAAGRVRAAKVSMDAAGGGV